MPNSPPERILETVERIEEDLTDQARVHGPLKLIIEVGEAIEVNPKRDKAEKTDPLMQELETALKTQLDGLAEELSQQRARKQEQTLPSGPGKAIEAASK
jgi:hypothetical protein